MKTIDLLVQELPDLGGWPDGAVDASFFYSEDTLYFFDGDGSCPPEWRIDMNHEVDDNWVEITREQYEAALTAKNEGWIEWGGGECPVPCGTIVDVKHRCGAVSENQQAWPQRHKESDVMVNPLSNAGQAFWRHENSVMDIIAYRLHQPQEVTEADDESDLNECIGQDAAQVWGGEGKPAIGEKCEHHSGGQWEAVTIAGIYENLVTGFTDYWMVKEDGSSYTVGNPYRFRLISSEADKRREEAIKDMTLTGWCESAAEEMYDLIAAGKARGVKLED